MAAKTIVVMLVLRVSLANIEERDKECGKFESCVKSEECPAFLEKQAQLKSISKSRLSEYSVLRRKLIDSVCNKKEKAVCCKLCECIARNSCKYADERMEIYKRHKSRNNKNEANKILRELRGLICEKRKRFICCPPQETERPPQETKRQPTYSELSKPDYLPRLGSCGLTKSQPSKVVNGEDTKPGEFPFAALLGYVEQKEILNQYGRTGRYREEIKWGCGGVLINLWYVLTAAHCQGKTTERKISKVRLGEWTVQGYGGGGVKDADLPPEQDFDITEYDVTVHNEFNTVFENDRKNIVNDIALIKLPRPATINDGVRMACLPVDTAEFQRYLKIDDLVSGLVGRRPTVVGWGKTHADQLATWNGVGSRKQQFLQLPLLNEQQCMKKNNNFSPRKSQICAGAELGKDSCRGDSGGGLFIQKNEKEKETAWYLIGIVSFGAKECGNGHAGVYTRVSSFITWIQQNIK